MKYKLNYIFYANSAQTATAHTFATSATLSNLFVSCPFALAFVLFSVSFCFFATRTKFFVSISVNNKNNNNDNVNILDTPRCPSATCEKSSHFGQSVASAKSQRVLPWPLLLLPLLLAPGALLALLYIFIK